MKIISTGSYVPENVLTNADLEKIVDTTDNWIVSRTGIKARHVTAGENTSDLAYQAALVALKNADIAAEDIDLIITCTCTPEAYFPSTSGMLQRRLGISCMAFDVNAACSGFVYGLTVAKGLMQIYPQYKYALLIGAEVLSKLVNWEDRNTCVLFGDGAGAVVLQNDAVQSVIYTYCDAKGDTEYALKSGGAPLINPLIKNDWEDYQIQMAGQEVFKFAVRAVSSSIEKTLVETGTTLEEIDYFICHQANYRILEKIAKDLGVSQDLFYTNLERYGNTSSASIPIVLDEMTSKGLLQKGKKIIIVGFGAGLTWGSALINW